jgi:NAD(P)-dependent dehydrogenase (short-subunit alcohol dehydrogenase family)
MDMQLDAKTALITGSTAGIGYAIAEGLAREGASVWVNGRKPHTVDDALNRLKRAVPAASVAGVAADVGTADGIAQLAEALPEVDILINNAGIFDPKPFFEIPDEDWQLFYDVNVMSGVRASRAYLPGMLARDWGRIVFISSESGIQTPREMIHYGMTKAAQLAISRGLAELTQGTAVTVNAVLPGPTRSEGVTEFVAKRGMDPNAEGFEQDFVRSARPTSLIDRLARVEEVANMVVYVASPRSSATNGAALRVDGGVVYSIV